MADGIRILENGDIRVTELSDFRITENYVAIEATASLTGTGTLSARAGGKVPATVSLTGTGTLSASGGVSKLATVALQGTGTLTANADVLFIRNASASLSAGSTLTATSKITGTKWATMGLLGTSDDRITETSDLRITEQGDIRITNEGRNGVAEGTLTAMATVTRFSAENYINQNGVWKESIPYAKHSGVWQRPDAVYKHINGTWKKVY